jgi:hypothetical protein
LIVGAKNAQMSDLIGVVMEPSGAGFLKSSVEDVAMTGLDQA